MTTNPFAAPAATAGFDYTANLGRLLVIEPKKVEENVPTSLGDKDAIRADITVLDGPVPGAFEDVLIFPRVLQGQLRSRLGQMVLGRLEQGVAKPGQNPPWRIAEATPADQQTGAAWLAQRNTARLHQPAPAAAQQQAPSPDPWAPGAATPQQLPAAPPF
ncbi:MAG: hypothetical protein LBU50_03940 [Cellulomonas sp.]|jgi:hypothetical protein|nr:hypothetical protein [Cellulomonas sp.]